MPPPQLRLDILTPQPRQRKANINNSNNNRTLPTRAPAPNDGTWNNSNNETNNRDRIMTHMAVSNGRPTATTTLRGDESRAAEVPTTITTPIRRYVGRWLTANTMTAEIMPRQPSQQQQRIRT